MMVFGFIAMTSAQDLTSGPSISIDKDVHDYGTISQGADGGCEFTVTNAGTDPLIISRCKGSCGCTVPKCDKDPVMPGATSVIKSVTITSNATNEPTKVIRIKGKVESSDVNSTEGAPLKPSSAGAPVNKE